MRIIVVGAGTAGISTVGALIQEGFTNITWIDPEFEAGAMKIYDGIPSNTKAKNLSKYAKHLTIFDKYNTLETTVDVFSKLEPQKETTLNQLKECLDRMTKIIINDYKKQVQCIKAKMTKIVQLDGQKFEVYTDSEQFQKLQANLVFLCLGADLKSVQNQPNIPRVNAFDIMSTKKIHNYDFTNDVVEVYGSSHSAVLCLRNLTLMKNLPKKIYHIMNRKELLHAQYIGDFIRHDTIGLKGVSSQFGKQYQKGKYKDYIVTQYTWDGIVNTDTTKVVEAVGFKPKQFQFVSKNKEKQISLKQGHVFVNDRKVPNLHLIGILSPQYLVDKQGQRMPAVGVDKFLCYALSILQDLKAHHKFLSAQ